MGTRAVNAHPDVQRAAGETHRMRQPGGHSMGLEPCEFDNALEDLPQARYVLGPVDIKKVKVKGYVLSTGTF